MFLYQIEEGLKTQIFYCFFLVWGWGGQKICLLSFKLHMRRKRGESIGYEILLSYKVQETSERIHYYLLLLTSERKLLIKIETKYFSKLITKSEQ